MAKKLKDLKVTSVDLCKQGANQAAHIALKKSAEADVDELMAQVGKSILFAYGVDMTDDMRKQIDEINKAMMKSEATIEADSTLGDDEKGELLEKSRGEYCDALTALMKGKNVQGKGEEDDEPDEEPDDPEEESGDPEEAEGKKKFPPRKKAGAAKGGKKKVSERETAGDMHPEVKKAIGEVAELRKKFEMGEMREAAKKYEVIGKSVDELAPKLYALKKSGDSSYDEYIGLLDEMVECTERSGIFKEFGSNRSGGLSNDLNQAVAEIRKSMPELSRAEAVVKAYEQNPELSEY